MRRLALTLSLSLCLGAPLVHASPRLQDEPLAPPGKAAASTRIEAVLADYDTTYETWYAEYLAAEGSADVMDRMPDPAPFGTRMMAVAAESPDSETAFIACKWVVDNVRSGEALEAAVNHLTDHFLDRPDIGDFVDSVRGGEEVFNRFLRGVLERASSDQVAATACYNLASGLKSRLDRGDSSPADAEQLEAEAREYLAWCQTDAFAGFTLYGDLTIGEKARADVFELDHLRPGKVAPEIEGEDIDGVPFKLSDARGKVVLLDFWGDW